MLISETQLMVQELGGKGYTCAQILLVGALRLMHSTDTSLVRSMSGLVQGIGSSGQLCGALAGGFCLLSLYTAKGYDLEEALEEEALLHEALLLWFSNRFCGKHITCDAILGMEGGGSASVMNPKICGMLVADVWDRCMYLLDERGIDPTVPRK